MARLDLIVLCCVVSCLAVTGNARVLSKFAAVRFIKLTSNATWSLSYHRVASCQPRRQKRSCKRSRH